MKTTSHHLLIASLLVLLSSCGTTESIRTVSDLRRAEGPVLLLGVDGSRYKANVSYVGQEFLVGSGTVADSSGTRPFADTIRYSSLTHIIGSEGMGVLGYAIVIPVAAVTVLGAANGLSQNPSASATEYAPGGGSCPLVMSWNGESWVLEGEAVGTALGRGLETETGTILPHLTETGGEVRMALVNNRPETHSIDRLKLMAVRHGGEEVILDPLHQPWLSPASIPADVAFDESGADILPSLAKVDGERWTGAPRGSAGAGPYTDELIAEFDVPSADKEIGISVRARNTRLAAVALQYLYSILGDEVADFIAAADEDAEMISLLCRWLDESSLRVSVLTRGGWRNAGTIQPEAVEADFERIVRVRLPAEHGPRVRVKLSMIHDGWMIDAVRLHSGIRRPDVSQEMPLELVSRPAWDMIPSTVFTKDGRYDILLPGDTVVVAARAVEPHSKKTSYILYTTGYLHEWPEASAGVTRNARGSSGLTPRLSALKMLMRTPENLLPMIYERWEEVENKRGMTED